MKSVIRVHQVSKRYKGNSHFSLEKLQLDVQEGAIFGLLGPNGAGKTTLIHMLCGMIQPSEGFVELMGMQYATNRSAIQHQIGVVPQEYALYPTLSATENLYYFGSLFDLPKAELKHRIAEGLEEVGLSSFADKPIERFSGGMKRRINLLAGLLHQPKILFLDEPTVGVDVQSKEVILQLLKRLNEQNGTTILYTSHHLNEAQHFCTEIAIIDHGKVITQGAPQQLIESVPEAQDLESVFIHHTGKDLRDYV
jgi:ABC-2 type transport system ATP-binding protein